MVWNFVKHKETPPRQERLWGLLSLLSSGYEGLFPGAKTAGSWSWPFISN